MHEFNLIPPSEKPAPKLKTIERIQFEGSATAELNKNHVLRVLGRDNLDGVVGDQEILLVTGAKLYVRSNGTGRISGYAADGTDVEKIIQAIGQGKKGLLAK